MGNFFAGFNWTSLGIDAGIIIGIVCACEVLKRKILTKNKNLVFLFVVIFSCIGAYATTIPLKAQPFAGSIMKYGGIATFLYAFAVKPIMKKLPFLNKG